MSGDCRRESLRHGYPLWIKVLIMLVLLAYDGLSLSRCHASSTPSPCTRISVPVYEVADESTRHR